MNFTEQELFFELCKFKKSNPEKIRTLIKENATPSVLGELFFNRMQGVAYGVLRKNNLLGETNREFRNSLKSAYLYNVMLNNDYRHCVALLSDVLSKQRGKYAMLKGALLCNLYPAGYRTSNDIDLLVRPQDVTSIGNALSDAGFKQGNVRNGVFIPATRREIVESKMTRGETVPYILEVGLPIMKYLEVDINFSLDYKNSDTSVLESMLDKAVGRPAGDTEIITLNECDFFIHLCCHLYKEATTLPWVVMKRDMTLYKFLDIYLLLDDFMYCRRDALLRRASDFNMIDICCCVVQWTSELFNLGGSQLQELADIRFKQDDSILHKVISPSDDKAYNYKEKSIKERFFAENRESLLEEV